MNNPYIKSIPVNLFSGIFNTTVHFINGLNLISGVNGTGKTEVLKLLKTDQAIIESGDSGKTKVSELDVFPISPKRNTEKKAIDAITQEIRTHNKSTKTFEDAIRNLQIKDSGFENYPTFGELFVLAYEKVMTDSGGTGYKTAVEKIQEDFNSVLKKVFLEYKIVAEWIQTNSQKAGHLKLQIQKYSLDPIDHEYLSTGEREVLALLFSIYTAKDNQDIYLIDEPEVHLNWNLEKGFFEFLDWFCNEFKKQVVAVTHSRVVFSPKFYEKTQFFVWKNKHIISQKEVAEEQKKAISGETVEIIYLTKSTKPIVFVEDQTQKLFIDRIFEGQAEVSVCGNKGVVRAMFTRMGDGENLYFLRDGDNEEPEFSKENFIHLQKYCIENYLFATIQVLSQSLKKSEDDIKGKILSCLKNINIDRNRRVFKELAVKSDASNFPFEVIDYFDVSDKFISMFSSEYNVTKNDLIEGFINKAKELNRLNDIFGEITSKISFNDDSTT